VKWIIKALDFRLWNGTDWDQTFGSSGGWTGGEGGQQPAPSGGGGYTGGEGGTVGDLSGWMKPKEEDTGPAPHVPVLRAAKNVQQANIDRSSLYDPTAATMALGTNYLQTRNASNPQPLGSTGAGAVGYDFTPSDERLY
jgi:hypothetical protein